MRSRTESPASDAGRNPADWSGSFIQIERDGTLRFIGDSPLAAGLEGTRERRRASSIEPCSPLARLVFRVVRAMVSDSGKLAAWTRRWPVRWRVRIHGGPIFGRFADRREAIRAEVRWLEEHQF